VQFVLVDLSQSGFACTSGSAPWLGDWVWLAFNHRAYPISFFLVRASRARDRICRASLILVATHEYEFDFIIVTFNFLRGQDKELREKSNKKKNNLCPLPWRELEKFVSRRMYCDVFRTGNL
jgi:hypothetical protein